MVEADWASLKDMTHVELSDWAEKSLGIFMSINEMSKEEMLARLARFAV